MYRGKNSRGEDARLERFEGFVQGKISTLKNKSGLRSNSQTSRFLPRYLCLRLKILALFALEFLGMLEHGSGDTLWHLETLRTRGLISASLICWLRLIREVSMSRGIRGSDKSLFILVFLGWTCPGQREGPAYLDPGFFIAWIVLPTDK